MVSAIVHQGKSAIKKIQLFLFQQKPREDLWFIIIVEEEVILDPFIVNEKEIWFITRRCRTNQGPIIFLRRLSLLLFTSQQVLRWYGELSNPQSTVMLSSLQFKHPLKICILIATVQTIWLTITHIFLNWKNVHHGM